MFLSEFSVQVCEPAGPGLDCGSNVSLDLPNCAAAKDTQVLHTSIDRGSLQRSALVDWLLGDCGIHQPGATTPGFPVTPSPYGIPWLSKDHGCCPTIYNWAFRNEYYAVRNDCCTYGASRFPMPQPILNEFRVGYFQPDGK